jgi:hypothetical protein
MQDDRRISGLPAASARTQRQRHLAFGQIIAEILADRFGAARIVEHVVDQLERDAQMRPVTAEVVLGGAIGVTEHGHPAAPPLRKSCAVLRWITLR